MLLLIPKIDNIIYLLLNLVAKPKCRETPVESTSELGALSADRVLIQMMCQTKFKIYPEYIL